MNFAEFSRHHKLTVAVFAVIGIAGFVFGIIRLQRNITLPFARKEGYAFKTLEEIDIEKTQKLKSSDTDQDGLTDYDELYIFRTSPFLTDTDSDGDADGAEVNSSQDPNCPKGKSCIQGSFVADPSAQTVTTGSPAGPASVATGITSNDAAILSIITETFGDTKELTPEKIAATLDGMSLDKLKEFLFKLGIPSNLLDKADEKTLRQLIKETLFQTPGATPSATAPTPTP